MPDVHFGEVITLDGSRGRLRIVNVGSMVVVCASVDGVWLRGSSGAVMDLKQVLGLAQALTEAQVWVEEQKQEQKQIKRSA